MLAGRLQNGPWVLRLDPLERLLQVAEPVFDGWRSSSSVNEIKFLHVESAPIGIAIFYEEPAI